MSITEGYNAATRTLSKVVRFLNPPQTPDQIREDQQMQQKYGGDFVYGGGETPQFLNFVALGTLATAIIYTAARYLHWIN